jgi:hypothetical protein
VNHPTEKKVAVHRTRVCFGKTSQVKPWQKELTLEVKQPVELIATASPTLCFVNLSTAMAVSTHARVPPPT